MRNPREVYRKAESQNLVGKDLEVAVLLKGARLLRDCQKNNAGADKKQILDRLGEACRYNQRIWAVFQTEVLNDDNPLPEQIKRNLLQLSVFVDKRLMEALSSPEDPDKLSMVIRINLNIAAGLRGSPEGDLPFDLM